MKEQIIKQISSDLKIKQFIGELDDEFYSRVIYTATSCWLRYVILDKSNNDADKKIKSKKYVLARGKIILENYIALFPECSEYFLKKDNEKVSIDEPIKCIRQRMLNSGELLEIEPNTYLTLPMNSENFVYKDIVKEIGLSNDDFNKKNVGIARISNTGKNNENKIRVVDPSAFLEWIVKNAKWEKINHPEKLMLFNPKIKSVPSKCWGDYQTNLLDDKIFLAKSVGSFGYDTTEYFVMKIDDFNNCFIYQINTILSDWNEQRRIILCLRKKANNPIKARIKNVGNSKLLKLFAGLPLKEQIILDTYCWPKSTMYNKREYVISNEIWDYIESILISLCIEIEEEY